MPGPSRQEVRRGLKNHAPPRFTWPQLATLVLGAAYFLLGLGGFAATDFLGFLRHDPGMGALGLTLNPAQNLLHVVLGLTAGVCAANLRASAGYGLASAVVFAALFLYGAVVTGDPASDVLNLNWPANVLHLVTALVGVLVLAGAVRVAGDDGWTMPRPDRTLRSGANPGND
ncbi:hypothetical protein JOF53_000886 [Crossiella equi]|uniref:DUF4383 domain-containing protein n=1 Tax=Crossiella equi TaxID=130796 RepID=A0ABS5A718_9PSEU|nr:DUF4383 domain-containing protein [Crossiella equi]MBP2472014.1 hypothetical protein [Crossiella equi]